MSGSLTVQVVQDRKSLARFVGLPWELYKDDPIWVAPLRREIRRTLDPRRNPFFKHADIRHFLAVNARGAAVGRVAACVYPAYNERFRNSVGFFGFLESIRDAQVVKSLLDEAEKWLASRGVNTVMGPYSYAPTQDMGLLVDGFDKPPALLHTYNPPFYQEFIVAAGYLQSRSAATYHGYDFEFEPRVPGLMAEADRICARYDLSVRTVNLSKVKKERALLMDIYNVVFADNREIVPITEDVFRFRTSSLLRVIDPRVFLFVECGGEALGVGVALPNFNEVLARCGGALGLGTIMRWKKTMRSIQTVVALLLCVRPKAHGLGISRVLLAHLLQGALRSGYQEFYTGFVDEQNSLMRAGMKRIGYPRPEKRFAIFKKEL